MDCKKLKIPRNNNDCIEICYAIKDMRKCHRKENNYFCHNSKLEELNPKNRRLLKQSNNIRSLSKVESHNDDSSSGSIPTPPSPRDEGHASTTAQTTTCTSIFEVGSTSQRCEAAEKYSVPLVSSNREIKKGGMCAILYPFCHRFHVDCVRPWFEDKETCSHHY